MFPRVWVSNKHIWCQFLVLQSFGLEYFHGNCEIVEPEPKRSSSTRNCFRVSVGKTFHRCMAEGSEASEEARAEASKMPS